jgi:alanine racemase
VAKEAGVTKATVSRALRNMSGVSEETRERIVRIARELNYWPSPVHQGAGRVYTGRLAFAAISEDMPRLGNEPGGSYLHHLLEGCRDASEDHGRGLMVCKLTIDQVKQNMMPAAVRGGQLDGLIVRGWWLDEMRQWLENLDLPYVLVDSNRAVEHVPQVQIENIQAMDQALEHVLERGGRMIAMVTGDMDHVYSQERLAGLQMAMTRRGISLPDSHIVIEHGYNEASGRRGVIELRKRNVAFDTLFCQNDLIALGARRQLVDIGLRIPQDVRLVGFDNMEFASLPEIGLTTIDSRLHKMGQMSTNLLIDKIDGKPVDEVHLRVRSELIVRQST